MQSEIAQLYQQKKGHPPEPELQGFIDELTVREVARIWSMMGDGEDFIGALQRTVYAKISKATGEPIRLDPQQAKTEDLDVMLKKLKESQRVAKEKAEREKQEKERAAKEAEAKRLAAESARKAAEEAKRAAEERERKVKEEEERLKEEMERKAAQEKAEAEKAARERAEQEEREREAVKAEKEAADKAAKAAAEEREAAEAAVAKAKAELQELQKKAREAQKQRKEAEEKAAREREESERKAAEARAEAERAERERQLAEEEEKRRRAEEEREKEEAATLAVVEDSDEEEEEEEEESEEEMIPVEEEIIIELENPEEPLGLDCLAGAGSVRIIDVSGACQRANVRPASVLVSVAGLKVDSQETLIHAVQTLRGQKKTKFPIAVIPPPQVSKKDLEILAQYKQQKEEIAQWLHAVDRAEIVVLELCVISGIGLLDKGSTKPFCEVKLREMADGKVTSSHKNPQKQTTKIVTCESNRKTLSVAKWEERFVFKSPKTDCLRISVFGYKMVGKEYLGRVDLVIPELLEELCAGDIVARWPLMGGDEGRGAVGGELELALCLTAVKDPNAG